MMAVLAASESSGESGRISLCVKAITSLCGSCMEVLFVFVMFNKIHLLLRIQ